MPLFRKSRKQKSKPKPHEASSQPIFDPTGFSSSRPPHPIPIYQPSHLLHTHTQSSTWQIPHHYPPQSLGSYSQAQILPYQYSTREAHNSSPCLPRHGPHSSPTPIHTYGQQAKWSSCQYLPDTIAKPCQVVSASVNRTTDYLNRGAALCDQVASKFNDIISLMDEETFAGNEQDLRLTYYESPLSSPARITAQAGNRGEPSKALVPLRKHAATRSSGDQTAQKALITSNVFEKASLYANSRLPTDLPPFQVYIPTWPLICLAAEYSLHAYSKSLGAERDAYVEADWRVGTKAMVIKSVPLDDMNTVIFAIRGTQTFMDWAVNLNTATVSPSGFLDDPGNLCHAGFLDVARKMIKPVASRLRQMLEENPSRRACSLVIAGHSAGGAVASLLFSHMLSENNKSELNILTKCFKRVHCVTFGAPPVSLLPLTKPTNQERRLRKSLFLSFINEGDPVTRADKAYIRSLMELYGSPAPKAAIQEGTNLNRTLVSMSKVNLRSGFWNYKSSKRPKLPKRPASASTTTFRPFSNMTWHVPPATLSNAGRLVLLQIPQKGRNEDVRACIMSDEELRGVVFGDPLMHQMKRYYQRVEVLATKAVTGRLMT